VRDKALLGFNYKIDVKLKNEINQTKDYVIEVVTRATGYETEESTTDKVIIVKDLEKIE